LPKGRPPPEALVAAAGRPRGEHLLAADELVNTRAATEAGHGLIVLDDRHRF
jgi:hypothetical protein